MRTRWNESDKLNSHLGATQHTLSSALPLRFAVPAALVIFAAIVAGWDYVHDIRYSEFQVEQGAVMSLKLEAASLQQNLDFLFSKIALEQVQQELAEKRADPEVEVALLADEEDRIIAAANRLVVGRSLQERLDELAVHAHGIDVTNLLKNVHARRVGEVWLSPHRDLVISVYPVVLGMAPGKLQAGRIGTLILARELATQKAIARRRVVHQVVGFALPVAAFAGLLFALSHLVITRRVTALVRAAQRFAAGDKDARAKLRGGDELAEVGAAFDEMAAQVSTAQQVLAESEERFRLVADSAPVMIWMSGIDKLCHYFNKPWLDFTGRTLEQEQGEGWAKGIHPDDLTGCLETYHRSFDARQAFVIEYRLRRLDGEHRWIGDHGVPRYDKEGRFAGYIGSCVDVTERKRAEAVRETLLELATKLGAVLQPVQAARIIFTAADQLWAWDSGVLDIYSPADDKSQTVLGVDVVDGKRREISSDQSPSQPSPRSRRILEHGPELILRQPPYLQSPDSTMFGDTDRVSTSIMAVPVRWQGQSVGILSIQSYSSGAFNQEDLRILQGLADECGGTLQRLGSAEALRVSEDRFRELAETIDEVFWVSDPAKRRVFYMSPAYERIWGRSCQSLVDEPSSWLDAIHEDDRERILQATTEEQAGGTYDEEYRVVRPDGSVRWIRDRAFPVRSEDGRVARIVGVACDVTESKKVDVRLRAAEKYAATGRMAAGIAHEINNPLAGIRTAFEIVKGAIPPDHADMRFARMIDREIGRISRIVAQMFALYKPEGEKPQRVFLHELIADAVELSILKAKEKSVEIAFQQPERTIECSVPAGALTQVILNLVNNAVDASSPGSSVRLAAQLEGPWVTVTVTDQGNGIPEELRQRIFEPFFTTKSQLAGGGLGLGLAVSRSLVEAMGGRLAFESEMEHGATFSITIPQLTLSPALGIGMYD